MRKIYVITSGEGRDYGICRITEDKDKAERYARYRNVVDDYTEYRVEEYGLDDFGIDEDIAYGWKFLFRFDYPSLKLRLVDKYECLLADESGVGNDGICAVVLERDNLTMAQKIAKEKLSKYLARKLGL